MQRHDLHHIAIRCRRGKLAESEAFYRDVLGMGAAERPDLGFPGAWMRMDWSMVHLMDQEWPPESDPWYAREEAGSVIDHIAVKAHGFDEMKKRVLARGCDWREMVLEGPGLWQLFVLDPNGVVVELNFEIASEPPGSVGPAPGNPRPYPPAPEAEPGARDE